jgi:hypothetical protein
MVWLERAAFPSQPSVARSRRWHDVPERQITLDEYKKAERVLAYEAARFGLVVHALIFILISALLVVFEFTLIDGSGSTSDQIPWSVISIGGMGLGLAAHWWFGYLNLESSLEQQQQRAEARAAQQL